METGSAKTNYGFLTSSDLLLESNSVTKGKGAAASSYLLRLANG